MWKLYTLTNGRAKNVSHSCVLAEKGHWPPFNLQTTTTTPPLR